MVRQCESQCQAAHAIQGLAMEGCGCFRRCIQVEQQDHQEALQRIHFRDDRLRPGQL